MAAPLPAGYTVYPSMPDAHRLDVSRHYLKMMVFGVESRPDGFDYDGFLWIVEQWLMFIKNFRGPGDLTGMAFLWKRRHKLRPVPGGVKRSQHLVATLKQLNHFLNPGETNLEGVYKMFDEVRTQMFEIVEAFRAEMERQNHKDLQKFLDRLDTLTARAKARW